MSGTVDQVTFAVEDALFDTVPYRPWLSPLGTPRPEAHPGDRRVIGRLDGEPVTVTDLPPHLVGHHEIVGYPRSHQYFEHARDFHDWVRHTAAGTRFLGPVREWDVSTRNALAARAVRTGLEWDMDGNIFITGHAATHAGRTIQLFRLSPDPSGRWNVTDPDTGQALDGDSLTAILDSPLNDVCSANQPLDFEIYAFAQ